MLTAAIGATIAEWQDATETFDDLVGRQTGLNSADRRCLSMLARGPQTALAIAREVRLSPSAVTALVDRLAAHGLVSRKADPKDRRRVLVVAQASAFALFERFYGPIARAGAEMLTAYSIEERKLILRFVRDACALQKRMIEELKPTDSPAAVE